MRPKLLYVDNDLRSFLAYRTELARAVRDSGFDVHVAAPPHSAESLLEKEGFTFHPIEMNRQGVNPLSEWRTIESLRRLYSSLRPNIIHHLRLKPVLYGGLAMRLAGVSPGVHLLTGLGHVFTGQSARIKIMRSVVMMGCKVGFHTNRVRVIFQNPDDRALFLKRGVISRSQTALIRGSGVDVNTFRPLPEPSGTPVIIMPSRMLRDKGVQTFVEAAERIQSRHIKARFVLVGDSDEGNPTAVSREQLQKWHDSGVVEWWGHRTDMQAVLSNAHIVCLPSLREGVPKALIEAAACGRAIVTTDVPGCREVVKQGVNGLLVPINDPDSLANAFEELLVNPERRRRLGEAGRQFAVTEFSIQQVIAATFHVYNEMLAGTQFDALLNAPAKPAEMSVHA